MSYNTITQIEDVILAALNVGLELRGVRFFAGLQ